MLGLKWREIGLLGHIGFLINDNRFLRYTIFLASMQLMRKENLISRVGFTEAIQENICS